MFESCPVFVKKTFYEASVRIQKHSYINELYFAQLHNKVGHLKAPMKSCFACSILTGTYL